jgi:cytochrome c oxidase assembly factor CtaG
MKMEPVLYQWHFDMPVVLFIAALTLLYYKLGALKRRKNTWLFTVAMSSFIIAEFSPLHYLGMHYYFSAHMLSHVILLLVCGPLFTMAFPADLPSKWQKAVTSLSAIMGQRSWMAWIAGVGVMWFWHIPAVFDAALSSMSAITLIPLLHAVTMLVAGMLFSWPLFGPFSRYHVHPGIGIVYLFTACISCSVLGLLITFAPLNTWHHYQLMDQEMGLNAGWQISRAADQQAAGLIMWVPCCFVYLSGCIFLLWQWFTEVNVADNHDTIKLDSSIQKHD